MARRPRKTFDQYLQESLTRHPELADVYEETRIEEQLAQSLVRVREERRMTQRALAGASGVAQPVIARLERGTETPTIVTLQKLARALDAKVEISADGAKIHSARPASLQAGATASAVIGNVWVLTAAEVALARLRKRLEPSTLASSIYASSSHVFEPGKWPELANFANVGENPATAGTLVFSDNVSQGIEYVPTVPTGAESAHREAVGTSKQPIALAS
jgi:transcriptional regulator with XRE-family HTH domain